MKQNFTITAKLWRWSGDMSAWHFIYVPADISLELRTYFPRNSMIKCRYTIGDTTWDSSMFRNNRENNYLIPIKKSVRKTEGTMDGDKVIVQVQVL